jgi:hypothetical protein
METKPLNNPNGANQWVADPRQQLFLAYYLDPKSETFGNALQSGLRAGFSENYSSQILSEQPEWLLEKLRSIRTSRLLEKAERNLDELLDLPSKVQAMGAFGPVYDGKGKDKKPVMVHSTGLLKVKADVTKFVAERVGKADYGAEAEDRSNKILIINVSNQSGTRYGINTSPSENSPRQA